MKIEVWVSPVPHITTSWRLADIAAFQESMGFVVDEVIDKGVIGASKRAVI